MGDARRTLRVCKLLINDRDELVVKALSWALRALVERDSEAVRKFIEENEPWLPTLVRREVRRKVLTGRKTGHRLSAKLAQYVNVRVDAFTSVAVGTTIADRPPHRFVRARLRIRLLLTMSGVEAVMGMRMQDTR